MIDIPNCNYYGYDIDKRSINYAKKKYNNKNYHFFCKKKFRSREIRKLPQFDFVILFGIMHHLNNEQVKNILSLCKKNEEKLKTFTEDPILIKNQNLIAKFLIKNDRGTNVRKQREYLNFC